MFGLLGFRLKAAGMHLLGSMVVIGSLLWMVYNFWYVYPFEIIFPIFDVMVLLACVDLVLGPLLTLIVFDIKKPRKELIRDISVILIVQISALLWGAGVAFKSRPQFVVFYGHDIYVITANDVDMNSVAKELRPPGILSSATFVYVREPQSVQDFQQLAGDIQAGLPDMPFRVDKYLPYKSHVANIIEDSLGDSALKSRGGKTYDWAGDIKKKYDGKNIVFFRIYAGHFFSFAAVDVENGLILHVRNQDVGASKK